MNILGWIIEPWLIFLVLGGVCLGVSLAVPSPHPKPRKKGQPIEHYSNGAWILLAMKTKYKGRNR